MILNAIKSGIRQMWQNKRIVLIYYIANLLFGIVLMLPLRSILSGFASNSLMGGKLAGRLDMDFLFEFFKEKPSLFSTYAALILVLFSTYWLLTLFLSGGAFSIFIGNEKYTSGNNIIINNLLSNNPRNIWIIKIYSISPFNVVKFTYLISLIICHIA